MKAVCSLLLLLALVSCQGKAGALSQEKALELTRRATIHFQLTPLPLDCLQFEEVEDPGYFIWVVRERHDANCRGDPQRPARTFTIRTHKVTGSMTTDAQNLQGKMELLR